MEGNPGGISRDAHLFHLKQCPLFQQLSPDELNAVFNASQMVTLDARQNIPPSSKGEPSVWVVKRGHVSLCYVGPDGRDGVVVILGPGDLFGARMSAPGEEAAEEESYGEVPVTLTSACLCRLSVKKLEALLLRYPNISYSLNKANFRRIHKLHVRMADLMMRPVDQRVAIALLDLAQIASTAGADGSRTLDFTVSQRELSTLVGSSREMVTRVMQQFRKSGLVHFERRIITLCDVARLEALGGRVGAPAAS
ncbi:MAG: Crp/Fnr family transcriptional regulator [Sumerlaeia bacterium]